MALSAATPELPPFTHLVVTRVNIRWRGASKPKDDQWVEKRLDLLEQICQPSLLRQICRNYTWLLYFDAATSPAIRRRVDHILECSSSVIHVSARYVESAEEMMTDIVNYALATEGPNKFLLTTRIDGDDAFHPRAICTIQEAAKTHLSLSSTAPTVGINLTKGLDFLLSKQDPQLFRAAILSNMFVSLLEKMDGSLPRTVYFCPHPDLAQQDFAMIEVSDRPYWLRVLHDSNIVSSRSYGKPTMQAQQLREFGFDPATLHFQRCSYWRNCLRYVASEARWKVGNYKQSITNRLSIR